MIEHEGRQYARVSEILQQLNTYQGIDKGVLQNKADIGTELHKTLEAYIKGEIPTPSPRIEGYYQSALKWIHAMRPTFTCTEQRFYDHDFMITGAIDGVVSIAGEEPVIFDWKTAASVMDSWLYQFHFYHHLAIKNGKELGHRGLFIKLDKTGKIPYVKSYKYDGAIMARCRMLVDTYWERQITLPENMPDTL